MSEIKWNPPSKKPTDGQRVVVLNRNGHGAAVGIYDSDMDEWSTGAYSQPHVTCDMVANVNWQNVTAWTIAP